jgi:hypothetical protein
MGKMVPSLNKKLEFFLRTNIMKSQKKFEDGEGYE